MTPNLIQKAGALVRRASAAAKLRQLALARRSYPLRRYAARRLGLAPKPYGVNLVAYVRAEMGLGEAARGVAAALDAANIPFSIVNYEHGLVSPKSNGAWKHKEAENPRYGVTLLCINPDNTTDLRVKLRASLLASRYVIGYWFWELPELPDEWLADFNLVNEVWAGSGFIQETVSLKSPVPVVRIPPAISLESVQKLSRSHFALPEDGFLFLTVCDTRSILERKNPLGALRAFRLAFGDDPKTRLIIKSNTASFHQEEMERIREEMRGCENVHLLDRVLTRAEMSALIDAVDCVVSLHRAEGFGLVPAEAMALGKPVIVTDWSGSRDYIRQGNCAAINYELVRLGEDYGPYKAHQHWAEPDIEQAAAWMKTLADDPALCARMGKRAQETIRREFSPQAVGELIRKRLEYIARSG